MKKSYYHITVSENSEMEKIVFEHTIFGTMTEALDMANQIIANNKTKNPKVEIRLSTEGEIRYYIMPSLRHKRALEDCSIAALIPAMHNMAPYGEYVSFPPTDKKVVTISAQIMKERGMGPIKLKEYGDKLRSAGFIPVIEIESRE